MTRSTKRSPGEVAPGWGLSARPPSVRITSIRGLLAARGIPFFSAPGCNKVSVGTTCSPPCWFWRERHELTLSEMSLCVIGAGNTGESVTGKAEALGMKVLRCDPPRPVAPLATSWITALPGCRHRQLPCPLSSEGRLTFHLLEPRRSPSVRPGRLINASRGGWTTMPFCPRRNPIPCDC